MNTTNAITMYGADWCADCQRAKEWFAKNDITYEYKNSDDEAIKAEMLKVSDGRASIPVIVSGDTVLVEPSTEELVKAFGPKPNSPPADTQKVHDIIMVGAGPAALSAAIYTTREDIETVLLERAVVGGLAAVTDKIDNYPGFPDGIEGLTLADSLRKQAERFGAVIELGEVLKIHDEGALKRLETTEGDMYAKAVLIATGSDYRKIGVPGEETYYARGVHYCATCDGAFYRGKRLVVVGGGNSAVQEALFLTRFATHIDLLVRSKLRASDVLQQELAKASDKITVHLATSTDEIVGDAEGKHVVAVKGTHEGQQMTFETDGVFVFVGLDPNNKFLEGSGVELDEIGLVKTNAHLQTNIKGIFAAGDIRSGATMQIASATGEGATAALLMREYLEDVPVNAGVAHDVAPVPTPTSQPA